MSNVKPAGEAPDPATVLLVEDDPKIASLLTKGLRREGLQVDWVSTGREALARLDEGGVALLLLDLGLPDIDGLEVLREMRERGMDVPVIVAGGQGLPDEAVRLGRAAGDGPGRAGPDHLTALGRCTRDAGSGPGTLTTAARPSRGRW
jgi:CheY-like chemotaxis protein